MRIPDYFNGNMTPETTILDNALGKKAVAIGDLIVLEILRGFRVDQDYNAAKNTYNPCSNTLC